MAMINFRRKDRRPPTVTLEPGETQIFVVNGVRLVVGHRVSGIKGLLDIVVQKCDGYAINRVGEDIHLTIDSK